VWQGGGGKRTPYPRLLGPCFRFRRKKSKDLGGESNEHCSNLQRIRGGEKPEHMPKGSRDRQSREGVVVISKGREEALMFAKGHP